MEILSAAGICGAGAQALKAAWNAVRTGEQDSAVAAAFLVLAFVVTLNGARSGLAVFNPDHPMVVMDGLTHFLNAIVLLAAFLTVLSSTKYLADIGANHGEYYALLLSSVIGMMFLVAATDLLMLFLALETMNGQAASVTENS